MVNRRLIAGRTYFAVIKQKTQSTGFFDGACKEFYLRRLLYCNDAFQVKLHAYLLMHTEIFLVFTTLTPSGFDSFVKFLNDSYSNYYSIRFARRVSTWRNQPLVCRLPSDALVRDCQKFVERYVLSNSGSCHPGEYRYSSYCTNAFAHRPKYLQPHRAFKALTSSSHGSLHHYREFIAEPFRGEYESFLGSRLLSGRPLLGCKPSQRLEENSALTDIEKHGTIAHSYV